MLAISLCDIHCHFREAPMFSHMDYCSFLTDVSLFTLTKTILQSIHVAKSDHIAWLS